jgi:hypothetical protein
MAACSAAAVAASAGRNASSFSSETVTSPSGEQLELVIKLKPMLTGQ